MKIIFNSEQKTQKILFCVLLLTFLVFFPSLFFGFTNWDDESHFLQNPDVLTLNAEHIKGIFLKMVNATYIPLTTLSFAVEHYFFGFNPFVFHFDNLMLHLAVVSLLFLFARRLGLDQVSAGFAALIFGIHPMHVESVVWVTERKGLLYSLFYLLSLNSYWSYLEGHKKKFYFLSLLWGLLSILSKPMALSLPLILLLCDWWKGRKLTARIFIEKIPFLFFIVPVTLLTYALNARVIEHDFFESILTWLWTLTFYIQKFVWPSDFLPLYALPRPVDFSNSAYLFSFTTVILMAGLLIFYRKNRWLKFACLYYFLSIFFLLRFDDKVDITFVADRYMYLPSLGFCCLFGLMLKEGMTRLGSRGVQLKRLGFACIFMIIVFLSVKTYTQSLIWKDSLTLWDAVIKKGNPSALVFYNRGIVWERGKNLDQALLDYNEAIKKKPDYAEGYNVRGSLYSDKGQYDPALGDLNKAIELNPHFAKAYHNRGVVFMRLGKYDLALSDYSKAIEIDPKFAESYNNRGLVYFNKQQLAQALVDINYSLGLDARNAEAYYNRGNVEKALGKNDQALEDYASALRIDPRHAKALNNRGNLYGALGQFDLAVKDYNAALKIQPGNEDVFNNLGAAYQALKEDTLALENFDKALVHNPQFVAAYANRGYYYYTHMKYSLSLENYSEALDLDSQSAALYFQRSLVYAAQKDWQSAINDAQEAKKLGYPDMDVYIAKLEKLRLH